MIGPKLLLVFRIIKLEVTLNKYYKQILHSLYIKIVVIIRQKRNVILYFHQLYRIAINHKYSYTYAHWVCTYTDDSQGATSRRSDLLFWFKNFFFIPICSGQIVTPSLSLIACSIGRLKCIFAHSGSLVVTLEYLQMKLYQHNQVSYDNSEHLRIRATSVKEEIAQRAY